MQFVSAVLSHKIFKFHRSALLLFNDKSRQFAKFTGKHKLSLPLLRIFTRMAGSSFKFTNRLINEKSPYLLQHAHNPVDWFPWGEEAFDKAKHDNKLIFLSVGYSTCHWCHVMERESFENEAVAKVMNSNFVCIKVDREERPDVDHLYMTFVQASTGSGGWPMSVWLTPNLLAVYGGTYYPPVDQYGRPGFVTILRSLANRWEEQKSTCLQVGTMVLDQMKKFSVVHPGGLLPDIKCLDTCFKQLSKRFDDRFGGFSDAPKFPQPVYLRFLLHLAAKNNNSDMGKRALDMVNLTLTKMANGGIHDHVSQGFARYSTDGKWHVPHFEKMLYDQGQLACAYADAYTASKDPLLADMVKDIMIYVCRDLSHKEGGFFSAEDADSLPTFDATEKKEGAFCVWKKQEILDLLKMPVDGKENITFGDVFCFHFNVKEKGNVDPSKDPHGELVDQNVLIMFGSVESTANNFMLELDETRNILQESLKILHTVRQKRPRPHLDDKMLTAWNGLMISGAAKAGQSLQDSSYIERAVRAAQFVRKYLYSETEKTLLRSCYRDSDESIVQLDNPIHGFLVDYVFLIAGLIDLYEGCYDVRWLEWADTLQKTQDRIFWDDKDGGYFESPAGDESILLRLKDEHDGAEPCGNSVSVQNLLRLSALLNNAEYQEKAVRIFKAFSVTLDRVPFTLPTMVSALLLHNDAPTQIFVTGKADNPETSALLSVALSRLIPGRLIILADGDEDSFLYNQNSTLANMKPVAGKQAAYVCRNRSCSLPVTTTEQLAQLLDQ